MTTMHTLDQLLAAMTPNELEICNSVKRPELELVYEAQQAKPDIYVFDRSALANNIELRSAIARVLENADMKAGLLKKFFSSEYPFLILKPISPILLRPTSFGLLDTDLSAAVLSLKKGWCIGTVGSDKLVAAVHAFALSKQGKWPLRELLSVVPAGKTVTYSYIPSIFGARS